MKEASTLCAGGAGGAGGGHPGGERLVEGEAAGEEERDSRWRDQPDLRA